ncbi:MAG: hypothetical protein ACOYM7_04485 [Paludibacter sp.]
MSEVQNPNLPEKFITDYSSEKEYSIYEIKTIYKKLNQILMEVMERIEDMLLIGAFDLNDIKFLKNRNCEYKTLKLKQSDVEEHGELLFKSILEATLKQSFDKSFVFFESNSVFDWFDKFQEYRTQILSIDGDSSFILSCLNSIYNSLFTLNRDFTIDLFDFEDDDIPSSQFDFEQVYNQIADEEDLLERKKIILNAIAERDLLCLKNQINPKSHYPNIFFQKNCNVAIDVLNKQIAGLQENNQLFKVDDASVNEKLTIDSIDQLEQIVKTKESSTRRQVLAMYYLLNEVDRNISSIDRTVKARFIHFLTQKNESNIYKTLSEPHKGLENDKNKKSAIRDLEYIKKHFDDLGLKSISQKITKDMQEA